MKKKLLFAFVLGVIGISALGGAENASATSVYDNPNLTETAILTRNTCEDIDVTNSWFGIMDTQYTDYDLSDYIDPDLYYWGVNTMYDPTNTITTVQFWAFKKTVTSGYTFGINTNIGGGYAYQRSGMIIPLNATMAWSADQYRVINLVIKGTGGDCDDYTVEGDGGWYDGLGTYGSYWKGRMFSSIGTSDGIVNKMLFANAPFTAPDGYEGETPPDSVEVPVDPIYTDFVPDWVIKEFINYNGMFSDSHFATFDGNPFLCEGDLAPVLTYSIWRDTGDEEVPDFIVEGGSGVMSATGQIHYDFGEADGNRDYYIIGQYDCGDEDTLQFDEFGVKEFTVNRNGMIAQLGLENCMQEEFPFFSLENCVAGMDDVLNLLAFNAFNPSNSGLVAVGNANPNACYEMQTLGGWIYQEGTELCPAFPSYIRTAVTPFIMFILGGMVFYWVTRGKGVIVD